MNFLRISFGRAVVRIFFSAKYFIHLPLLSPPRANFFFTSSSRKERLWMLAGWLTVQWATPSNIRINKSSFYGPLSSAVQIRLITTYRTTAAAARPPNNKTISHRSAKLRVSYDRAKSACNFLHKINIYMTTLTIKLCLPRRAHRVLGLFLEEC